ncbi:hypothetical protein DL96DRAFT_1552910 [Flagelloscypha sp. PMI_526]|nr:hypothetical protein DL96DRAFT_1552910 [Flagelloscypha sp. PMI_526]
MVTSSSNSEKRDRKAYHLAYRQQLQIRNLEYLKARQKQRRDRQKLQRTPEEIEARRKKDREYCKRYREKIKVLGEQLERQEAEANQSHPPPVHECQHRDGYCCKHGEVPVDVPHVPIILEDGTVRLPGVYQMLSVPPDPWPWQSH